MLWHLFQINDLYTTDNEPVTIIYCGKINTNAGPDFLEARVKIANTILVGNIELHLKSSDWLKHGHQKDLSYSNIILHVVLENDTSNIIKNVSVLELKNKISNSVINQYNNLINSKNKLPCSGLHSGVKYIIKENWLSTLLAERWEQKLADWNIILDNTAEDWRNLLYYRIAANFGFKINSEPFLMLAQSLPLNILAKHKDNELQIEAMLFGQAGMLEGIDFTEDYPEQLQQEYSYIKKLYKLSPIPKHLWKFLRMRPANFPTIRIAQFAQLIIKSTHLFAQLIDLNAVRDIEPLLDFTASSYWHTHFTFDEVQKTAIPKKLGKTSIENIIINTIAPIQFLYASRQDNIKQSEDALNLLETVAPEKNTIIELWKQNNWHATNAAQSQAMLQLYNNYCNKHKCLDCAIGNSILRSSK